MNPTCCEELSYTRAAALINETFSLASRSSRARHPYLWAPSLCLAGHILVHPKPTIKIFNYKQLKEQQACLLIVHFWLREFNFCLEGQQYPPDQTSMVHSPLQLSYIAECHSAMSESSAKYLRGISNRR